MASKQSPTPKTRPPRTADNFLLIKGIGPAIVNRLHNAGIQTYVELVSLSPMELAERVPGISAKLIAQQNWIGQARKLASKKTYSRAHKKAESTTGVRQHYENFTIEFLLNEKNTMRRTRIVHIQSGNVDTWSGWEAGHLIDFLIRHADIRLPAAKPSSQTKYLAQEQPLQAINNPSDVSVISLPESISKPSDGFETEQPLMETFTSGLHRSTDDYLTGQLRLRDLKIVLDGSDAPILCLYQNQLYQIRLTLDLADVTAPSNIPLLYKATVTFTQFGGPCQAVYPATGTLISPDSVTLSIAGTSLTNGTYRLDAYASLAAIDAAPGLTAILRGDLVQVY